MTLLGLPLLILMSTSPHWQVISFVDGLQFSYALLNIRLT